MSAKPETKFMGRVHKFLPSTIYHEKTSNPYKYGIADVWYSGYKADLWIEYKFIPKIPRSSEILPDCSLHQLKWLAGRYDEGRNVAVVLGVPKGGVIYRDKRWEQPLDHLALTALVIPELAIAQWIIDQVGADTCQLSASLSRRRK